MDEVKQTLMTFAVNLKPAVDFMKGLLQKFQEMPEPMKKMILGIAGVAIAGRLLSSFFSKAKAGAELSPSCLTRTKVCIIIVWRSVGEMLAHGRTSC